MNALSEMNVCRWRRRIRQMTYDDLLVCGDYSLEYLCPLYGYPYYRLSRCGLLVGIVDVWSKAHLAEIHHQLAVLLHELGLQAEAAQVVVFGAQTPPDANKHRLPHLLIIG